jgi:hypothetical protein
LYTIHVNEKNTPSFCMRHQKFSRVDRFLGSLRHRPIVEEQKRRQGTVVCGPATPGTHALPWGCAPRASPRSWRPPRELLRASTAASPPPRTTSQTPSLVSAVHRALMHLVHTLAHDYRLTRAPPARACPSSSSPQATSTRRGLAALHTQAARTRSLTTMSRMPPNLRFACS